MNGNKFIVEPMLIMLRYGGWLATTSPETSIRIGVIGASEGEARTLFDASLKRWKEINEAEEA